MVVTDLITTTPAPWRCPDPIAMSHPDLGGAPAVADASNHVVVLGPYGGVPDFFAASPPRADTSLTPSRCPLNTTPRSHPFLVPTQPRPPLWRWFICINHHIPAPSPRPRALTPPLLPRHDVTRKQQSPASSFAWHSRAATPGAAALGWGGAARRCAWRWRATSVPGGGAGRGGAAAERGTHA